MGRSSSLRIKANRGDWHCRATPVSGSVQVNGAWSVLVALPRIALGGVLALLAACSPPPGLEAGARIPPSDQPLDLLPLDGLLAQANGGDASDAAAKALAARAKLLRARAAEN